jgi:hypothetical protein
MPENRFGGVSQQPLYNATGRINRGEAPQAPQFQSMNAGAQKNFGAGDMPNNAAGTQGGFGANLMQSAYYGSSPINLYGGNRGGGGRRGRRGSGGAENDGGNIDNSITIGDFTGFGANSGMKVNQQGMGGQNLNAYNPNSNEPATQGQSATQGQQSTKPKRVVTPEQQAARKTRDQQNRSGARTPVARGPRQKPAVAGAATYSGNTSAPTIQANNTDARSSSQTINAGASTPSATQQGAGPGQPGAPAISFGSVTGASLGKPAKIGPTKVGKK